MILILFVLGIILSLMGIGFKITIKRKELVKAFAQVDDFYARKYELLNKMILPKEITGVKIIDFLRGHIYAKRRKLSEKITLENDLQLAIKVYLLSTERNHELESNPAHRLFREKCTRLINDMLPAMSQYNEIGHSYNQLLATFPVNILSRILRIKPATAITIQSHDL